jgi:hypothetical protein
MELAGGRFRRTWDMRMLSAKKDSWVNDEDDQGSWAIRNFLSRRRKREDNE